MQLQNSETPTSQTPNRKRIFLVLALIVLLLVVAELSILSGGKDKKEVIFSPETRYDSNSGETVSAPNDKTLDKYGMIGDAPIFLGFSGLIDNGLTLDQLNNLKYAFYQYGKTSKLNVKEVSLTIGSINPVTHDRFSSSTIDKIKFNVVLDQKTTNKIVLEYWDFTTIRLYVYDIKNGKLLYDSQAVKSKSLQKL